MATLSLVVNADDFGLSERVNEGIIRAHRHGILTSASLIASGSAVRHAIALARETPTLDIGVHLTLIEERPVCRPEEIATLVEGNGRLHPHAMAFVRRYLLGRISLEQIGRELDAQIAFVVSTGLKVSHFDGHQHLHMLPAVRRLVGELARKYGVPFIRYPKEAARTYMFKEAAGVRRIPEMLVLGLFCAAAKTSDALRADHFCGFFYGGRLSKENLLRILDHLPAAGSCEVICHPGLTDADSRYKHWGYRWQEECDALTDSEVRDRLRSKGVRLVTFADLQATHANPAS
jgi:hopanoid biosynthesis associated protein HpnK